jgi:DNA-binding transcriptional MerR regulator
MKRMRISDLARASATSASAIRYYERIGLLPRAARAGSDQRFYGSGDVARVAFIRRCRALGFTLQEIAAFSQIARSHGGRGPCRDIVCRRLTAVREQAARLRTVEARLVALLNGSTHPARSVPCEHLAVLR